MMSVRTRPVIAGGYMTPKRLFSLHRHLQTLLYNILYYLLYKMAWEQLPASLEATQRRRRRRPLPGSVRLRPVDGRSAAGQNCVLVVAAAALPGGSWQQGRGPGDGIRGARWEL